ncbi:MAG TPA: gephyrin-like molybdotransferase Glp [Thermomicrobiales bacterium]|nr:gephyrin-like molybdotransferase Glp [Thermomicrobiales bacterium]
MIDERASRIRSGVLTPDEARSRILAALNPLPATDLPLDEASGLILAQDVSAKRDLPPFDNSAMDGFALIAADTVQACDDEPVTLAISGEIPAGHTSASRIEPGQAMRIMTGAPIPAGADAVERIENVDLPGEDRIALRQPVKQGENIRPAGEDARAGDIVLRAGTRLHPGAIGLLAATGHASALVHRRPAVGVLVTGDEVVSPGEPLAPGQIWNSNGPMIAALVRQCGGVPVSLGTAGDNADALRERIRGADEVDMLITTGGVSVGDFDLVKDVLRAEGDVDVWRLKIRPGKPLAFGKLGRTIVLGLPGNPVAAAVAYWQFGRVAILAMLGWRDTRIPEIEARVTERIVNRGGRTNYVRVQISWEANGYVASLAGHQGSAMLTSLARADGLLVIPEECEVAEPGMMFRVQMPHWGLG